MRTAIVGGGAAGFFLAINLKEMCPQMEVTIFEKAKKVLAKVEVSGGGRCNCTNSFEGVTDLVNLWYSNGLINHPFPLHNDILKIFIELGALGFTLWAGINYILYPSYWMKQHDTETGLLYIAILAYMSVTYLTDNTAFYFWSCIGLKLIPMSYSYRIREKQKQVRWKAPTPDEAMNEIRLIEMGE